MLTLVLIPRFAEPADDTDGEAMLPVRAFRNLAPRTLPSLLNRLSEPYQLGDPLVEVAHTRCPADADPDVVCERVFALLDQAACCSWPPRHCRHRPQPLARSFRPGDAISIGENFYVCQDFGFKLIPRPTWFTISRRLPDLS